MFCLPGEQVTGICYTSGHSLLQNPFKVNGLQYIHGLLPVLFTMSGYAVQFPVFTYNNRHLLTSIQNASEGVVSLGALEWYDDSLVEWLQE